MSTRRRGNRRPSATARRWNQGIALGSGASACQRLSRLRARRPPSLGARGRCADRDQALEPSGCRGIGSYAIREAWALSGSTRSSWLREVMSSLVNTLRRW